MNPRLVNRVAEAIYNTHWGLQTSGGYPPCWVDLPPTTKEFLRKQAIEAIREYERPHPERDEHGPA